MQVLFLDEWRLTDIGISRCRDAGGGFFIQKREGEQRRKETYHMIQVKKELVRMKLEDIIPYENNPRNNDDAVPDVAASMEQCGDLDPIEVDENNVILSGHTRLKALQQLGETETDVIRYTGVSEERKKKYRLLANKTGEKATWNFSLLEGELDGMDFEDYDFGFDVPTVNMDELDSLFAPAPPKDEEPSEEPQQIQCPHCGEWFIP